MVRRLLLALSGGLCSLYSFAPYSLWPLQMVALALLFLSVRGLPRRNAALVGFTYGLALYLPLLHWSGIYVGALPWILLSALQAAFIALFSAMAARTTSPVALASLWVLAEALASRLPWGGFGWGRAAYTQVESPLVVVATLGGATALSFVVALIGAGVAHKKPHALLVLLLIPLALTVAQEPFGGSIKVAAVQGNVPQLGLDFNAQREAVLNNHLNLAKSIAPRSVDLVVLPENASDVDPYSSEKRISEVVNQINAPWLIGGIPQNEGKQFNSSILWLPQEGPTLRYDKQELAPFGEFMPLRSIAEKLVPEAKRVIDFTPGSRTVVFPTSKAVVGPVICFEVLNDGIIQSAINAGAELLAVQTNSATFGRSPESLQQLEITRLRAIEHQRSIVSVSTSGVSALITPAGKVVSKSQIDQSIVLKGQLPLNSRKTLADRLGGWSELLLASLWFLRRRA